MARRNDHTREEIKEMAIIAGLELIRAEGFKNFSTRKVAANIGYSVGTLYNVFKDFDDMMFFINIITLDALYDCLDEAIKRATGSQLDQIKAISNAYISFATVEYHCWSAIFDHRLPQDAIVPVWYDNRVKSLFTLVNKALEPVVKDPQKCAEATKVLWTGIHGICSLSLTKKLLWAEVDSVQALTDSLVENYFKGLIGDIT